jgi:hypothetical protein
MDCSYKLLSCTQIRRQQTHLRWPFPPSWSEAYQILMRALDALRSRWRISALCKSFMISPTFSFVKGGLWLFICCILLSMSLRRWPHYLDILKANLPACNNSPPHMKQTPVMVCHDFAFSSSPPGHCFCKSCSEESCLNTFHTASSSGLPASSWITSKIAAWPPSAIFLPVLRFMFGLSKKRPHSGCPCRLSKISLFAARWAAKSLTTCFPSSSHVDRGLVQWTLEDSISWSISLSNSPFRWIMSPIWLETQVEGSPPDDPDSKVTWGSSAAFRLLKVPELVESGAAASSERPDQV